MTSGFVLLTTFPGREADVLADVGRLPGVTWHNLLFPSSVAVRLEGPQDALEDLAAALRHLDGVRAASLYRGRRRWRLPDA